MNEICKLCEEGRKIRTDICPNDIFCLKCADKMKVSAPIFEVINNLTQEYVGAWIDKSAKWMNNMK